MSGVKDEAALAAADLMDASESIQKEIVFQQTKQYKNQVQGFLDGVLLESEIPSDMRDVAMAYLQKENETDKKRIKAKQLQCDRLAKATPQIQEVHKVWVEDAAWAESYKQFAYVAEPDAALFFVVRDVAKPPATVLWTVMLQGGFLIDADHLHYQSLGQPPNVVKRGGSFAYDPAVRTKRHVLLSPKFKTACPVLTRVVAAACSHRLSQWKLLDSWAAFVQRDAGKGKFDVVAMATSVEAKALNKRNIFSKEAFLIFFKKVACVYNLP